MAARGLVNGRGPLRRSGRDLVSEYAVLPVLCSLMLLSAAGSYHIAKRLVELFCRSELLESQVHTVTPVVT